MGAAIARLPVADGHPLALHDVQRRDERGRVHVGVKRERLLVERSVEVEGDDEACLGGRHSQPLLDQGLFETALDQSPEEQERWPQLPLQVRPLPHALAGRLPITLAIH